MATPLKGGRSAPGEAQPAPQQQPVIVDNPPTSSLSQALKQSQSQFDKAK